MLWFDRLKQRRADPAPAAWTVVLPDLPTGLPQMMALPQAALSAPQDTAALLVAALCVYPAAQSAALDMLQFLCGGKAFSFTDQLLLDEYFRRNDQGPYAFFAGATEENGCQPAEPYTVTVLGPSDGGQRGGPLTLYLQGARGEQPIRLHRARTGQWFLEARSLLESLRPEQ